MTKKYRIALIDDDKNILTSLQMALEDEGFDVDLYHDGVDGVEGVLKTPPDLVLLDIKMPRMDGLEALSNIRRQSSVPVIFLTSKDEEIDELFGLRMGADDYIKKPFSLTLLLTRIRALLRRLEAAHGGGKGGQGQEQNLTVQGSLALDGDRHSCTWEGKPVDLTITEFLILKSLTEHPGHVKTRNQLIDAAYGSSTYTDDRTIDTHIKRLRRKFKEVDDKFTKIETLYGLGYRYRED